MLTRLFSATRFGARLVMGGGVALALLAAPLTVDSAFAGGATLTCVGTRGSLSCVGQWGPSVDPHIRHAPGLRDPREEAEAAERERRGGALPPDHPAGPIRGRALSLCGPGMRVRRDPGLTLEHLDPRRKHVVFNIK